MKAKHLTRKEDKEYRDFLEFRAEMRKVAATLTADQWQYVGFVAGSLVAAIFLPMFFEKLSEVKVRY